MKPPSYHASKSRTFVVCLLRWPGMEALVRTLPTKGVLPEQVAAAYFDAEQLTDEELEEWHCPLRTAGGMRAFLFVFSERTLKLCDQRSQEDGLGR